MAKFSNAGSTGGGLSALERLASQGATQLPTGPQEAEIEAAPAAPIEQAPVAAAPEPQPELAPEAQQRVDDNLQSGITSGFDEIFAEEARQSIPDLRTRWKDSAPVGKATASAKADGGIISRANRMSEAVEAGDLFPAISLANTPGFTVAQGGRKSSTGG